MLKCPHCNERTIPFSKALFTRTMRAKHCSHCDKAWRISMTAVIIASVGSVISIQVALSFDFNVLFAFVLCALIAGGTYYFCPLSKIEVSE